MLIGVCAAASIKLRSVRKQVCNQSRFRWWRLCISSRSHYIPTFVQDWAKNTMKVSNMSMGFGAGLNENAAAVWSSSLMRLAGPCGCRTCRRSLETLILRGEPGLSALIRLSSPISKFATRTKRSLCCALLRRVLRLLDQGDGKSQDLRSIPEYCWRQPCVWHILLTVYPSFELHPNSKQKSHP